MTCTKILTIKNQFSRFAIEFSLNLFNQKLFEVWKRIYFLCAIGKIKRKDMFGKYSRSHGMYVHGRWPWQLSNGNTIKIILIQPERRTDMRPLVWWLIIENVMSEWKLLEVFPNEKCHLKKVSCCFQNILTLISYLLLRFFIDVRETKQCDVDLIAMVLLRFFQTYFIIYKIIARAF